MSKKKGRYGKGKHKPKNAPNPRKQQRRQQASTPTAASAYTAADSDSRLRLRLQPVDTWFFRESRPFNSPGASELGSLFPPPAITLAGALRTAIGDAGGHDWQAFGRDPQHPLRRLIGYRDELGALTLDGPCLSLHGEPLFPAPAFVLARDKDPDSGQQQDPNLRRPRDFKRLRPGPATETDLGYVHLPTLPAGERDYKPLERSWLTHAGLATVLAGGVPGAAQVYDYDELCSDEPR
jgi:CRISPR-associated protein Cmr3